MGVVEHEGSVAGGAQLPAGVGHASGLATGRVVLSSCQTLHGRRRVLSALKQLRQVYVVVHVWVAQQTRTSETLPRTPMLELHIQPTPFENK